VNKQLALLEASSKSRTAQRIARLGGGQYRAAGDPQGYRPGRRAAAGPRSVLSQLLTTAARSAAISGSLERPTTAATACANRASAKAGNRRARENGRSRSPGCGSAISPTANSAAGSARRGGRHQRAHPADRHRSDGAQAHGGACGVISRPVWCRSVRCCTRPPELQPQSSNRPPATTD